MALKSAFRLIVFLYMAGPLTLWALPATIENLNYKVTLSETLPGVDDQVSFQAGPTITVSVQDKVRSNGVLVPLSVYAINHYYLGDSALNLLCRTTPRSVDRAALFTLFQLDLSNSQNSRQFRSFKQYSFSPDDHFLLGTLDGEGKADAIVVIRLTEPPAQLEWVYGNGGGYNALRKSVPDMAKEVVLQAPIVWAADSSLVAFLVSAGDGTKDGDGKPVLKDYLVCVRVGEDGIQPSAEPIDLSPYHYHQGSALSDLQVSGDKATLFFSQANSSENLKAEFKLPEPAPEPIH